MGRIKPLEEAVAAAQMGRKAKAHGLCPPATCQGRAKLPTTQVAPRQPWGMRDLPGIG